MQWNEWNSHEDDAPAIKWNAELNVANAGEGNKLWQIGSDIELRKNRNPQINQRFQLLEIRVTIK